MLPALYTIGVGQKVTVFGKKVDTLKDRVYSYHQGIGSDRYFNWEALYNKQGDGIMQKLKPVEKEIFNKTNAVSMKWYENGKVNTKELESLYLTLTNYVTSSYKHLFDL